MAEVKRPEFIKLLILFFKYSKLIFKAKFEYKFNAFLTSFAVFGREIAGIVIVYLILKKFVIISNWTMNEMLFLFSLLFLSYSLLIFFFTGIRDFEELVYSGEFDRYLVRPQGLLFQVIASKADYYASFGHGTVGIILFLKTANAIGIHWNLRNIVYYILAVAGGVMIQASIFMAFSCFSFWTVRVRNLMDLMFFNFRKFAGYPISFYPWIIQKILIFVIPFAFVNYFPAQFFLRKPDMSFFWDGYLYLTPVVGTVMFILASIFWKFSLKHYSSTGNSI
jgi:ABC-2 type transport system permease protein